MGDYGHGTSAIELPLIDFAPDLAYNASVNARGVVLIDMDGAMPTTKGYQCLNSLEAYAEAPSPATGAPAPEDVLGSTVTYFSNGVAKIYFGGPTQLWRLDGNSWVSVGSGFNTKARWRFAQWGDDVIAVNSGGGADGAPVTPHPPIVAPLVAHGATGTFAPLAGGPPTNATTVVSVNGQVMMFSGADWYCSALDTDSDWTPDVQTQAGHGPLYDFPGSVVAAVPLFRNVVVFKETATWLFTYVGGRAVWSNQPISNLTGTWCQESVIVLPDKIAFVGRDDFYTCSGYTPQHIPNNLKEWFFDIADPTAFRFMLSRYDETHGICYWYFVSRTPPLFQVPDRWIGWNSRTGKWAAGYLDETEGAISVPFPNQQPGILTGLIFQSDRVLRSWTGAPGAARYDTGYFGVAGTFTQAMRAKPVYYVEPERATLLPWHTRTLGGADINGGTTFLNQRDGWYYFRQYDRWHRIQIMTVGPNIKPTTVSQTGCEISALAMDWRPGGWR